MKNEDLEKLKEYLGLDDIDDARKAQWILNELEMYGDWGHKVSVYLSSILSGTEGSKSFISEKNINAYKSLFSDFSDKLK